MLRKIKRVVNGYATQDGAGVKLVRILDNETSGEFDPFLMLDSFDSTNPDDYTKGFTWHPHRGMETITYLIEGEIDHQDSLGNKGVIKAGESQWMNSGSGVMHQEMPISSKRMLGFQLWLNLPKKNKMSKPSYQTLSEANYIKTIKEENGIVKVISGDYHGIKGFKPKHVKATILDVDLNVNETFELDVKKNETLIVFNILGDIIVDEELIAEKSAVLLSDGNKINVSSTADTGARFIIFQAKPLKEKIAWAGPIVMNDDDELKEAFEELNKDTFVKDKIKMK